MLIKTRGIVLRVVKYGETSIITDIYTEERGLQTYIINGVRTAKARIHPSLMQLGTMVSLVAHSRDNRSMNYVKEAQADYVYMSIPFQILKSSVALFMVELIQKTVKEAESNPMLFQFLTDTFQYLDTMTEAVTNIHLCFMVQLSGHLGFQPSNSDDDEAVYFDLQAGQFMCEDPLHQHSVSKEYAPLMKQLIDTPITASHTLLLKGSERRYLLSKLVDYYRLHIENFQELNSIAVLQEVL